MSEDELVNELESGGLHSILSPFTIMTLIDSERKVLYLVIIAKEFFQKIIKEKCCFMRLLKSFLMLIF